MKIVALSDTHGSHREISVPECDVMVFAGDMTNRGEIECVRDFAKWAIEQPARHVVAIAGNHDWCFYKRNKGRNALEDAGIIYLQDEMCIIDGIKFWGSPWQPEFCNWAFNLPRGEALREKWQMIPEDTDVLITHGPPLGILDDIAGGPALGDADLLDEVTNIVKPKVHIFGHIHDGYGTQREGETTFVNASLLDEWYNVANTPIEVTL